MPQSRLVWMWLLALLLTTCNLFKWKHDAQETIIADSEPNTPQVTATKPLLMQPQDDDVTLPAYAYLFYGSGLGSQLLNFFAKALWFREAQNRSMMAIEATYGYRLNHTHGVLTSFFTPQFPVIDTSEQYHHIQEHMPAINVTQWIHTAYPSRKVWKGNYQKPNISLVSLLDYRLQVFRTFNKTSVYFYQQLARLMCPHLQFNQYALQKHLEPRRRHIPSLRAEPPLEENRNKVVTVAFHIRRGDKLKRESKKYEAIDYLHKFASIALKNDSATTATSVRDCFLATDDAHVVTEMENALRHVSWNCRLHTLFQQDTTKNQTTSTTSDADATITFMTELWLLTEATYFVGSFNSNVGSLVSILRTCSRQSHFDHYGRSYGVDRDAWYFR